METVKDYCTHRLLIAGPKHELKQFERKADWSDIPGASDIALLDRSARRVVWVFVTEVPALSPVRLMSRRWPALLFLLNYDCEDCHLVGLVRAKNGRLTQHRFKY
jgi:hypothetical protein